MINVLKECKKPDYLYQPDANSEMIFTNSFARFAASPDKCPSIFILKRAKPNA